MADDIPPWKTTRSGVLGDSQLQTQTLEDVGTATNYHSWLTDLARPYLGEHPLELGSGLGDYAQRWLDSGTERITVTELDPSRFAGLNRRFCNDDRVQVRELDLLAPVDGPDSDHGAYSSIVAFNVLEHIPDDVEALAAAKSLVRPGGAVIMFVPAFEFAMSDFDRKVGHVRRYTRASLRTTYERAGLQIEMITYVNMPGIAAWTVGMKWLKMTPGEGPLLRVWDGMVVPTARRLERRVSAPFGQSVFAVGRVGSGT